MARLKAYHWPGNVRELENLVRRLTVLYAQDTIGAEVIEAELREGVPVRHALVEGERARWLHQRRRPLRRADLRRARRAPAAGRPVRQDPARGRAAADRAGAHRDARQSAAGCGAARRQSQYAAQEDPRTGHRGDARATIGVLQAASGASNGTFAGHLPPSDLGPVRRLAAPAEGRRPAGAGADRGGDPVRARDLCRDLGLAAASPPSPSWCSASSISI